MGDSLEGGTEQSLEAQNVSIVDYRAFNNYIRKAITILLFDDSEELTSSKLEEALDENRANQECIKKFLSDPQVQTLYIQKCYTKGEIIFPYFAMAIFFTFLMTSQTNLSIFRVDLLSGTCLNFLIVSNKHLSYNCNILKVLCTVICMKCL